MSYQGTPQFQPIDTTTVQRAVNTDKDILKVGDLYYMCFQGVWFMSRTPTGPWEVTGDVPKAIYTIPVSSPSYSVTYVTVQSCDADDGGVRGVSGVLRRDGRVGLRGVGHRLLLSACTSTPESTRSITRTIRRTATPAAYNPWTGAYTRGAVAYGPYGGAGAAARYNPTTGVYSRGAVAYGPYGATAPRKPTTRAPGRTARRPRVRTRTAAGARRASSAAINGPARSAPPTTRPA